MWVQILLMAFPTNDVSSLMKTRINPSGLHMGLETVFVKHRACGIFLTDKSHHKDCGASFCVNKELH